MISKRNWIAELPRNLVVRGPTYFSQKDEEAFFAWLQSIPCVKEVGGKLRDLHISLKRPPTDSQLRELIALFHRYDLDLKVLAAFKTDRNVAWLTDEQKFWHKAMFGRMTRKAGSRRFRD